VQPRAYGRHASAQTISGPYESHGNKRARSYVECEPSGLLKGLYVTANHRAANGRLVILSRTIPRGQPLVAEEAAVGTAPVHQEKGDDQRHDLSLRLRFMPLLRRGRAVLHFRPSSVPAATGAVDLPEFLQRRPGRLPAPPLFCSSPFPLQSPARRS